MVVIDQKLESNSDFESKVMDIFKTEFEHEFYSEMPIKINTIYIWDVRFGNTGYGQFRRAGEGITIKIEGTYLDEDGDECSFKEEYNYSRTIDSCEIDRLNSLEYGSDDHVESMRDIVIDLLERNVEHLADELNEFKA
ncbi:hypothetical protein KY328_02095 [Candidatus Woesearchaeota archaeon]|nr:hypothetical protein [Candidatus Woesearchaeota archaeon]